MYKCRNCEFITDDVSVIANHYKYIHHKNSDELCCDKCNRKFESKGGLKIHKKTCEGIGLINHICPKCGFNIKNNINKHINSCDGNGPRRLSSRIKTPLWNKGLSKENNTTLKKISEILINRNKNPNNIYRHTEKTKKILSEKMLERYSNGWESTAGRCKKITYISNIAGEIKVDGNWELQVAKYLDSLNVLWIRNKKRFKYFNTIKQKISTYCPDFYVYDWKSYIEVKGYKTELDDIKWKQFTEKLEIWDKKKLVDLGLDIKYKKK